MKKQKMEKKTEGEESKKEKIRRIGREIQAAEEDKMKNGTKVREDGKRSRERKYPNGNQLWRWRRKMRRRRKRGKANSNEPNTAISIQFSPSPWRNQLVIFYTQPLVSNSPSHSPSPSPSPAPPPPPLISTYNELDTEPTHY